MTTLLEALEKRLEELGYNPSQPRDKQGRWTSGGGGAARFDMSKIDSRRRTGDLLARRRWAGEMDRMREFNEAAKVLSDDLKANRRQVRVRIPDRLIEDILIVDQRLKTQHESGGSGGMFDPDFRDFAEMQMFGAPETRPIYGYIGGDGMDNGTLWYGRVSLVLKPEVQDRTTITLGDSLSDDPPAPVKISELKERPSGLDLMTASNDWGAGYGAAVNANRVSDFSYIEAQIFGGVTKDDIAKVILTEDTARHADMLREAGYEVEITDDYQYSISDTEEFSEDDEFACYDASCAPPPVGTGGSKKAGPSKGRLSPTDSARVKPEPLGGTWKATVRAFGGEKAFGQMYEADLSDIQIDGNPVQVRIDRISDYGEDFYVQGSFYAGDRKVGDFARNIGTSDDGKELWVDHARLSLREDARGLGIAQRFNDHAMKGYEELGIDRIYMEAALSFGPFAWARQGYRINEEKTNRHDWVQDQVTDIRTAVKSAVEKGRVTQEDADEMMQTLTDLRNASYRGADVQPIHIASIGEGDSRWTDPDTGMWLGKSQLIGEDGFDRRHRVWNGVYYLGRESVLASAFERRMEELACRDRSCAPPPVGTGGSKPSGSSGGFSKARTFDEKREVMRAADNASIEADDVYKAMGAARDKYYHQIKGSNEDLEAMYRAEDAFKLLRWKAEQAQFESLKSRMVEMEVEVKIGRRKKKFMVYKDDTEMWDDSLVDAAVQRYASLLREYDVPAITLSFGPLSTARAILEHPQMAREWANGNTNVFSVRNQMERWQDSNGYVMGDIDGGSLNLWTMGVTGKTAAVSPSSWSKTGFNRNVTETLDDKGRAEYVVTHEFGHMLYFNSASGRGMSEEVLLLDSGLRTEWGLGYSTEGLRLPSLGSYAYSNAREFAAESFAVDYYGWDDQSGVPLNSMLGWAYERRY